MNLLPHLLAEYARRFPYRDPKAKVFSEDILILAAVLMRQIDPTGKKPIIEPAAFAEGVDRQLTARPTGGRKRRGE